MNKNQDNTGFYDLLFNCLLIVTMLFTLSFMMIKIKAEENEIKKPKAEFLITLTWQQGVNHDVDLWIRDPNGTLTFFRELENGITHLDRDDLGSINDKYMDGYGIERLIPINQEIATIRGFLAGEWIINIHYYRMGEYEQEKEANCQIIMTKLNPKSKIILTQNLTLTEQWEEKTAARIMMDGNGEIIAIENNPPIKLAEGVIYGHM